MVWLDHDTLLVGRGFRTNAAGIEQLSALLQPLGVKVIPVELPYWNGPNDVLHLMSFISLLDDDLAVVYRRILPVPLFELLSERGVRFVDVPEQEYDTLGCNVLAVAPSERMITSGVAALMVNLPVPIAALFPTLRMPPLRVVPPE